MLADCHQEASIIQAERSSAKESVMRRNLEDTGGSKGREKRRYFERSALPKSNEQRE